MSNIQTSRLKERFTSGEAGGYQLIRTESGTPVAPIPGCTPTVYTVLPSTTPPMSQGQGFLISYKKNDKPTVSASVNLLDNPFAQLEILAHSSTMLRTENNVGLAFVAGNDIVNSVTTNSNWLAGISTIGTANSVNLLNTTSLMYDVLPEEITEEMDGNRKTLFSIGRVVPERNTLTIFRSSPRAGYDDLFTFMFPGETANSITLTSCAYIPVQTTDSGEGGGGEVEIPPIAIGDGPISGDIDYLVARYIWKEEDGNDLDTRTYINFPSRKENAVGWDMLDNDSNYLEWHEDDDGTGETVLIRLANIVGAYSQYEGIEIKFDAFWYSGINGGDVEVEVTAYKGGTMVLEDDRWLNPTGTVVQRRTVTANTLIQESENIPGENIAIFSYGINSKEGNLVSRKTPTTGTGNTDSGGGGSDQGSESGNGPMGTVDPNNPVYPPNLEGFTFSVENYNNTSSVMPFDIYVNEIEGDWALYSGTLKLGDNIETVLNTTVSISTGTRSMTALFKLPAGVTKTYTFVGTAGMVRFSQVGDTTVPRKIVINRFSQDIETHKLSVGKSDLVVPSSLPDYITTTRSMFSTANTFNQDISGWDTSNVTDMYAMFANASMFNRYIGDWDVGNVKDVEMMFVNAVAFNQDLSGWNTMNMTSMNSMFQGASSFNQDLSKWCVTKKTNLPNSFLSGATNWTLPKPGWGSCPRSEDGTVPPVYDYTDIKTNNPNSTTGAELMVYIDLGKYTGKWQINDIGSAEVLADNNGSRVPGITVTKYGTYSQYTSIQLNRTEGGSFRTFGLGTTDPADSISVYGPYALEGATFEITSFSSKVRNYQLRLGENELKVPVLLPSTVTKCTKMFLDCYNIASDITQWDMRFVTDMTDMFQEAKNFNQDISGWDVSNVDSMTQTFWGALSFNQPIQKWDVSKVYAMTGFLRKAKAFNQDLSGWCVTKITGYPTNFSDDATAYVLPKPVWGTCPVIVPKLFRFEVDNSENDTSRQIDIELHSRYMGMILRNGETAYAYGPVGAGVKEVNSFPYRVISIVVEPGAVDVFEYSDPPIEKLTLSVNAYNDLTAKVRIISFAENIQHYQFSMSKWPLTIEDTLPRSVTTMNQMFLNSKAFNSDISGWDTSKISDMTYAFYNNETFNQDLSRWDVSKIPSAPNSFATKALQWVLPKPVWGTDGKTVTS